MEKEMLKSIFCFTLMLLTAVTAQAGVTVESLEKNYSSNFESRDPEFKMCATDLIKRHIAASTLPDMTIEEPTVTVSEYSVRIGGVPILGPLNFKMVHFWAHRSQDTTMAYRGRAAVIVNELNSAGQPARCQLYQSSLDEIDAEALKRALQQGCNLRSKEYLSIQMVGRPVAIDGCAIGI